MSEEYGHSHKKEILIILGLVFLGAIVALSGAFSNNDPAAIAATTTTTTTVSTVGSGFSPPAETNSGSLVVTDEKGEKKPTKAMPNPKMVEQTMNAGYKNLDDAPTGILFNRKDSLYIIDFRIDIDNARITGALENRGKETVEIVKPFKIDFKTNLAYPIPWSFTNQNIEWQGKVTRPKFAGSKYQGILVNPNEKVHFALELEEYSECLAYLSEQGVELGYVKFY